MSTTFFTVAPNSSQGMLAHESNASHPTGISYAEKIVEASILTTICLIAIFGNTLLWIVIIRSRHLRTTSNALVLCLSGADVLVSTVNMPVTIVTIINEDWVFSDTLCVCLGFINMVTFITSVMSLGLISINRYVLIVHPQKFKNIYNRRSILFMVQGVWLLSALLGSPPLFGWAEYAYLHGQSFCFCRWKSSISYTFFMVGTCFGGPCSVMTFSYARILMEVRRSRRRVTDEDATKVEDRNHLSVPTVAGAIASKKARTNRQRKRREEELKLTKSFLVVIFVFIISWLPFCVTMFWSVFSDQPVPRPVDMTTLLLGYFNSCCNPIIYGIMNKRFRQGYIQLLSCRCKVNTSLDSSNSIAGDSFLHSKAWK
ncbi:alpha-1A adrenergic receptor-like [Glandiceps talaboti]